jgi:sulfatase maturation enzyme AslB (radical SAM superfamily)
MSCKEAESSTNKSMRTAANSLFAHHLPLAKNTNLDGSLPNFAMHYYDIRLNNICNFKCRTCSGVYSSSIAAEEGDTFPALRRRNRAAFDNMVASVMEHLDEIEIFYFAGGEPMLMQEHYDILDTLLAHGKSHVKLNYNTNISTLTFKGRSVLDLWNQFEDVNLGISLDGSWERAAYIRNGSNWEQILGNIALIKQNAPKVKLRVATTISTYNALSVVDFHNEMIDTGIFTAEQIDIASAFGDINDLRILPAEVKSKVEALMTNTRVNYKSIVQHMNSIDKSYLYPEYLKHVNRIDALRGESLTH